MQQRKVRVWAREMICLVNNNLSYTGRLRHKQTTVSEKKNLSEILRDHTFYPSPLIPPRMRWEAFPATVFSCTSTRIKISKVGGKIKMKSEEESETHRERMRWDYGDNRNRWEVEAPAGFCTPRGLKDFHRAVNDQTDALFLAPVTTISA